VVEDDLDTQGWAAVCLVAAGSGASLGVAGAGDADGAAAEAGEVGKVFVIAAGLVSVFA
jgi:hypothetical protein